jgi:hypothetical protein
MNHLCYGWAANRNPSNYRGSSRVLEREVVVVISC